MARIIRGKHKNKEVKIHQFCNDWISVRDERIPNQESIFKPTNFQFTPEEKELIQKAKSEGKTGFMFNRYYWDVLTLKRQKYVV